ncbi:hypothetical protein SAMN05216229_12351 [Geopseudomonas sagittaria]|uniref:Uncharacterized protein n=1 Tax=Geopseudomonas sagittaria TaxID=1135990 RepID=A0A1I5YQR0_9GAMM|nr:hypothetical protein [Pseudomonas sagittaria]SFQ46618.1 hypothetical protein SAMN05216229_12351 [Pseudomonas sagittaria]
MSKPDYSQFDATLLDAIRVGKTSFAQLTNHKPLMALARPFCAGTDTPEWRIVDRRLQALRKAGKIKHASQLWTIVE